MGDVLHVYSGCEGWAIIFCETKNNVTEMEMNLQKKKTKHNIQFLHDSITQSTRKYNGKLQRM